MPMEDLGIERKFSEPQQTRTLGEVEGSYTYFAEGDVLLAKITPCFENGKLGIARGLTNGAGFGSSEFIVFRTGAEIDREWLYYFLSQDSFRREGEARMGGAVGHKRVALDFVEGYQIPLPPLPEQKRIVAILDEVFAGVDTAIANTDISIARTRQLYGFLANQILHDLEIDWPQRKLGTLCTRITKGSSPKWQGISYVDRLGILFITSENVREFDVDISAPKFVEERFNAKERKSILREGDILTNIVGASIGRTAIFRSHLIANINQAVCLIRCDPDNLNNEYLLYILNSWKYQKILHDNETNNARANLSLSFFSDLTIPMPPLELQAQVAKSLSQARTKADQLADVYRSKRGKLFELKQALLQRAFAGDLTTTPSRMLDPAPA